MQEELKFRLFLAHELGRTLRELDESIDQTELILWEEFFAWKTREEHKAIERAKRRAR